MEYRLVEAREPTTLREEIDIATGKASCWGGIMIRRLTRWLALSCAIDFLVDASTS